MENDKTQILYDWLVSGANISITLENMLETAKIVEFLSATSWNSEVVDCLEELQSLVSLSVYLHSQLRLEGLNKLPNLRSLNVYALIDDTSLACYQHSIDLRGLSLLKSLYISIQNRIDTLQMEGLEALTNLENLDLRISNAPTGSVDAFKYFTKLQTLSLGMDIDTLPEDTFINLTNLSNLSIYSKFKHFPKGIEDLENLQFLHVHFQHGNICLDKLKNLRELSLWFSDSDEMRKIEIPSLPYLHSLSIDIENSLNTTIHTQSSESGALRELNLKIISAGEKDPFLFVEGLEALDKFRVFKLRTDFIAEIPGYFANLPLTTFSIERLGYEYDIFGESFPDVIRKMTSLIILNVRNLGLTHIPEWICELTRLEELDLQYNSITSFPTSLKKLKNLKTVYIDLIQIMDYDTNEQIIKLKNSLPEGCHLEITDDFY